MEIFVSIAVVIGIIFVYFLPSFIAHKRQHPSHWAILIVNIFFGWTFLGWLICLIWALCGYGRNINQNMQTVHVHYNDPSQRRQPTFD